MATVRESADVRTDEAPISRLLFLGLTVAATGGPLALAAVYVPGVLGDAAGSAGLVALLAAAAFVPALLVWLGYSRQIAGPGGLYAFVEAAAGRRVALAQAGLWVISYLLYLVYTITYIAYDLLPSVFPALTSARVFVQLATALLVAGVAVAPIRTAARIIGAIAGLQVVLVVALAVTGTTSLGSAAGSFVPHHQPAATLLAGGNTSILFICASLPLFLGGEVSGGRASVRRGLAGGWAVVAALTLVAAVPMAVAGASITGAAVPGVALARAAGQPGLATAVGAGVAASTAALIVIEFLALSRLGHALTGRPVAQLSRVLAVVLVVGSAASLADPARVYQDLLKPSLVALWLAQLLVFAVYPRFAARLHGWRLRDFALAGAASALMLFGLWSTIINQLAS
jgi:amino acid transporter